MTTDDLLASPIGALAAYWLDLRGAPERCTKVVSALLRLPGRASIGPTRRSANSSRGYAARWVSLAPRTCASLTR
jgi:hypothetical protein